MIIKFYMIYVLSLTGIPELSKEAAGISIWCLTENADCYKQWVSYFLCFVFSIMSFMFIDAGYPCFVTTHV